MSWHHAVPVLAAAAISGEARLRKPAHASVTSVIGIKPFTGETRARAAA